MLTRREFAALAAVAPALAQTPRSIDDFFNDFTAAWMRRNPNLATATRYFTGEEQDALERQLTPETTTFRRESVTLARRGLAELRRFDRASLMPVRRTAAELLDWQLSTIVAGEPFLDYRFPLEQFAGANVNLVEGLTVRHPLATEHDAQNYVAALGQIRARMEEAMAEARTLEAKNILPPKFILQATVRQMQSFTDPSPARNPFVTLFAEKMAAIPSMSDARRQELLAAAEKITSEEIYPVWKKAIALLESQQPKATNDAGLWRFRNGPAIYAYFLYQNTSTKLTAAQIHEIGLRKVAEIEKQMDELLRRLGRTAGSVKDRVEKLKLDMQYPNPASEESREQIMRDIDAMIADALKRSAASFDVRPKSPVFARPFPSFRETNAAANYNAPAPDGSRPGIFQFPRRMENMTKFGLRSLVYHETVPGHHFHIALQVENQELPRFQQIRAFGGIPAISEGWGLYAERFAAEDGWYGSDIEGLLGQLNYELFRARRLVVDTGLHAMKWTRQQAIDYGIEASEIERYVVAPGQACAYMVGELKIIELREKARQQLGDKFSLREYHTTFLKAGVVPLEMLERQVDDYIAAVRARPAAGLGGE